ncbi:MAG TPA: cation-transporting P-type ATPase, partial [Methylocystis sp.]|nr:cation-transporting P-type ATPase [Methylocystis sp.]
MLFRLNFMQAASSRAALERRFEPQLSRELLAAASMDEDEVLALVSSRLEGLDEQEALTRLAVFGPNVVSRNGAPTLAMEFWDRAKNPLNLLLLSLAAFSYLLGDLHSAIIISV